MVLSCVSQMIDRMYKTADCGGKEKGWLKPDRMVVLGVVKKGLTRV